MGKFNPEGVFYLHLTMISFLLIVFTVLKNFNFDDFRASSILTKTQVNFIYLFLIIGIISIILFLMRGYFFKTPKYYTRAGIALVFIVVGIVLILGMLYLDRFLGNEQKIGSSEILGILFGSFITVMGSLVYISIKFPDEQMMKYFKQAVKEEIRRRGREERQLRYQQRQDRQLQKKLIRSRQVQVQKKKKQKKAKVKVQEVQMAPVDELTVVKCAKCQRSLKLSTPERPVTIKCPYCEAIGVIKE